MTKTRIKICPICGAEHTKRKAKCCCVEHSKLLSIQISKARAKPKPEKICPKCGKHHTGVGRFCSRHCANGHIVSEETKRKISLGIHKYVLEHNPNYVHPKEHKHVCKHCGSEFLGRKHQQYCSRECARTGNIQRAIDALKRGLQTLKEQGKIGGYREGSGRSKSGYYKGVYCGSTYELVWLIYQMDHGKDFKRFEGVLEWNGVKYIPDFLQDGKIIELKGYWQEKVDQKCEVARHFGYDIEVLYRKDLEKEFDWVKQHYTYHDLEELYDDYAPKYTYVCSYCGKEFTTNKRIRTETTLCSRTCAGKLAAKRLHTPRSNS